MTAFDRAWDVVKMPVWTVDTMDDDFPEEDPERFPRVMAEPGVRMGSDANIGMNRTWESKEGDARGHARIRFDEDDVPSHAITEFEIATDQRGKGLARERLRQFIQELKDHDERWWKDVDVDLQDLPGLTHVVGSEEDTAAFWDKMVEEGILDSAHRKPYVTTDIEGNIRRLTTDE